MRQAQDALRMTDRLTEMLFAQRLLREDPSGVRPDLLRLIQQLLEPEGAIGSMLRGPMGFDRAALIASFDADMGGDELAVLEDLHQMLANPNIQCLTDQRIGNGVVPAGYFDVMIAVNHGTMPGGILVTTRGKCLGRRTIVARHELIARALSLLEGFRIDLGVVRMAALRSASEKNTASRRAASTRRCPINTAFPPWLCRVASLPGRQHCD